MLHAVTAVALKGSTPLPVVQICVLLALKMCIRDRYDIYSFCYYKKAVCKIDSLSYILFKYPRTYATRII